MVAENSTHDVRNLLGGLRDNLAQHDRPIAFLFGAGTSCAVRVPSNADEEETVPLIPNIAGLTTSCEKAAVAQGEKFGLAWQKIFSDCKETKPTPNIEDVLSRLRMMLEAVGNVDTLAGLHKDGLSELETTIRQEIARVVNPPIDHILGALPHRRFARWLIQAPRRQPVEIFTVNYDILIESALEAERVPLFDGFVGSFQPFFLPDSLRHLEFAPGMNWTRLWKMHGSVTWRKVAIDGRERLVRGEPDQSGEMILPSFQKYDESRQQPYAAFADRFARFLDHDGALLVVCGFGFGDEHINNVIFEALESRPRTHVYALQFDEQNEDTDLVQRSYQRHNMVVIGPETGIIGGKRGRWDISGDVSVFSDVLEVKKPKQDPEGGSKPASTNGNSCAVRIGDFNQFCSFLASMMTR